MNHTLSHSAADEPQVTVIIPAYNAEATIAESIDSVIGQDGVSTQIILVDDGSTDSTAEVVEGYGDAVEKYEVSGSGPGGARNAGARHARGTWLAFLDADDLWEPAKLRTQLLCAKEKGVGLVYTNVENFGPALRVSQYRYGPGPLPEGDLFDRLLLDNFLVVSSVLIRRDTFDDLGGFESEVPEMHGAEDWDLWLRFFGNGGTAGACPEPLAKYRWYPDQMSKDHDKLHLARLAVIRRALQSDAASHLGRRETNRIRASAWQCSASFAAENRPLKALRWYLRSLWYSPTDAHVYRQIVKCCLPRS